MRPWSFTGGVRNGRTTVFARASQGYDLSAGVSLFSERSAVHKHVRLAAHLVRGSVVHQRRSTLVFQQQSLKQQEDFAAAAASAPSSLARGLLRLSPGRALSPPSSHSAVGEVQEWIANHRRRLKAKAAREASGLSGAPPKKRRVISDDDVDGTSRHSTPLGTLHLVAPRSAVDVVDVLQLRTILKRG